MYLVQIFLPLYDNQDMPLSRELFRRTRDELFARFGGMTAYTRAPASGLWQDQDGSTVHDELVVYEVMTEQLDEDWWRQFRLALEQRFRQESLMIRAQESRIL